MLRFYWSVPVRNAAPRARQADQGHLQALAGYDRRWRVGRDGSSAEDSRQINMLSKSRRSHSTTPGFFFMSASRFSKREFVSDEARLRKSFPASKTNQHHKAHIFGFVLEKGKWQLVRQGKLEFVKRPAARRKKPPRTGAFSQSRLALTAYRQSMDW
jgi:hypothetical protein